MSGRLAALLGIVTIAAAIGVVSTTQPASADLVFGDCPPGSPANCDPAAAQSLGVSTANWVQPTGSIPVTTQGFNVGGGPADLFLAGSSSIDPFPQSGLGIADPSGSTDHEINSSNGVDISTPQSHAGPVHGTLSIDSLQPGESFIWCAQPTAGAVGGTCSAPIFAQTNDSAVVPVSFGGANPFLTVTAATGDVKISDFDQAVSVPEPGTLVLLLSGMAGLVLARRRRSSI